MNKFRKIYHILKKPILIAFLVFLVLGSFIFDYQAILGATYHWAQSSWSGGADTVTTATHASNQIGWTKYYSASTTISASTNLTLSTEASTTQHTTTADFGGTHSQTVASSNSVALSLNPTNYTLTQTAHTGTTASP
ncbi:hypothetical protein KKD04_00825 [Patescibacteria group bacterium]|nr:hypothetical protein [Patescibacteria group bacterium]